MRITYQCELCRKTYNTKEEAFKCEQEHSNVAGLTIQTVISQKVYFDCDRAGPASMRKLPVSLTMKFGLGEKDYAEYRLYKLSNGGLWKAPIL